jgi:hypothetical protein
MNLLATNWLWQVHWILEQVKINCASTFQFTACKPDKPNLETAANTLQLGLVRAGAVRTQPRVNANVHNLPQGSCHSQLHAATEPAYLFNTQPMCTVHTHRTLLMCPVHTQQADNLCVIFTLQTAHNLCGQVTPWQDYIQANNDYFIPFYKCLKIKAWHGTVTLL